MKIVKIFMSLLLCVGLINGVHAQTNTVANTKATAQLTATCSISADNVSFGQLMLPLTAQGASSTMNVLCSKSHSYTVGLAYGGIYGTGSVTVATNPNGYDYGTHQYICSYSANGVSGTFEQSSIMCPSSYTVGTTYSYGKMIGAAKGDNVAYSISVPGNPSQIWNAGGSSYTATGTGSNQSIPINAKIVPGQSGSSYPTPDVYMDTVTATISF